MHENNREKVLFYHRLKTSAKGSEYVTEDVAYHFIHQTLAVHKICTQEMNLKTLLDFITTLKHNLEAGYTLTS